MPQDLSSSPQPTLAFLPEKKIEATTRKERRKCLHFHWLEKRDFHWLRLCCLCCCCAPVRLPRLWMCWYGPALTHCTAACTYTPLSTGVPLWRLHGCGWRAVLADQRANLHYLQLNTLLLQHPVSHACQCHQRAWRGCVWSVQPHRLLLPGSRRHSIHCCDPCGMCTDHLHAITCVC